MLTSDALEMTFPDNDVLVTRYLGVYTLHLNTEDGLFECHVPLSAEVAGNIRFGLAEETDSWELKA